MGLHHPGPECSTIPTGSRSFGICNPWGATGPYGVVTKQNGQPHFSAWVRNVAWQPLIVYYELLADSREAKDPSLATVRNWQAWLVRLKCKKSPRCQSGDRVICNDPIRRLVSAVGNEKRTVTMGSPNVLGMK